MHYFLYFQHKLTKSIPAIKEMALKLKKNYKIWKINLDADFKQIVFKSFPLPLKRRFKILKSEMLRGLKN